MNRLFLFFCIFLLLGVLACDKKDEIESNEYPVWLKQKVREMPLSGELCEFNLVMTIKYNNKIYYNIQMSYSSCMYCEIYDESGSRKTLNETEWNDFITNLKIIKSQSTCNL
jgi:hypothetical protein